MMLFAPTEGDIQAAQEHVAILTKRRDLHARLETVKAQAAAIEAELHALPITVGVTARRSGWLVRAHQRVGLA